MTILRLSVFSMPYINKLKALEEKLSAQEQKLSLIKHQIRTIQEILPSLTSDEPWYSGFSQLENLQREELRVSALRRQLWAEIKTIISSEENNQKPLCDVIQIRDHKTA